jgi:hypothetical protein
VQEGEPGGTVLAGDDVEAERLAEAVPVDRDRVHDAGVDGAAALAALDLERVQDKVRVGRAVGRADAEVLDDLIETLRQPRDLAPRHPLDPELLHERLDPPCLASLPQLRNRELDRAHALSQSRSR